MEEKSEKWSRAYLSAFMTWFKRGGGLADNPSFCVLSLGSQKFNLTKLLFSCLEIMFNFPKTSPWLQVKFLSYDYDYDHLLFKKN